MPKITNIFANSERKVIKNFLSYVAIDTQSQENSKTYPSTKKQWKLLHLLQKQLTTFGVSVTLDQYGYLMATIPSNVKNKVPTIGFFAHVDTSPDVLGKGVKPQVIKYQGGDIFLTDGVIITEEKNPSLRDNIGKTIVTTDGTTLLGADDKAGIAIIMTAIEILKKHPEIPHGEIKIVFNPDEEINKGMQFFDVNSIGAYAAYTVDGGRTGNINRETFNAELATISIFGLNIHPGEAKNVMINSIKIASAIITRLPKNLAPETTSNFESFIHPVNMESSVAQATIKLLLRAFTGKELVILREQLKSIITEVQSDYPQAKINLIVESSYRNIKYGLNKDRRITEYLYEAVKQTGIIPKWEPIRGGTDGTKLTENGLPTANIFTGGENAHSKTEWVSVWGMCKAVEMVVNLAQIWAKT